MTTSPSFRVVHHVEGPRVSLGLAWFVVAVGAALQSTLLLAVVMAVAAALAADQLVGFHHPRVAGTPALGPAGRARRLVSEPTRVVTVLGAAALPLAAAAGADTLAGAIAAVSIGVLAAALGERTDPPALAQSLPVLAALPIGLAAASPVLLSRLGTAAGVTLLVLVAAYDAGDFVVGTGAGTAWEGPVAGVAAVAVVGFGFTVLALPPLEEDGSALLALLVALLAPLGPPIASVLVGDGTRAAGFVRRLDSLLLGGPLAAYAVAAIVTR